MNQQIGKENKNSTQTPSLEYHTNNDDFIAELVRKVVEQMHATNTPILSYEAADSPVWVSDYLKSLKWQ